MDISIHIELLKVTMLTYWIYNFLLRSIWKSSRQAQVQSTSQVSVDYIKESAQGQRNINEAAHVQRQPQWEGLRSSLHARPLVIPLLFRSSTELDTKAVTAGEAEEKQSCLSREKSLTTPGNAFSCHAIYQITIIRQRVEKTRVFEQVPIAKHAAGVWEGAAPAIRESRSHSNTKKLQRNNQNPTR